MALSLMTSTSPLTLDSLPMGSWRKAALCPSLLLNWASTLKGSPPVRSSLLMKAMQGTL